MKLAIPFEDGAVFEHFDRAAQFCIYTAADYRVQDSISLPAAGLSHQALALMLRQSGVDVVLCNQITEEAALALEAAGLSVHNGITGTADGAAKGIMLGAVGVANGEKRFPGYCITITRVTVNGQDVTLTPGYTTTDDGSVTRETFYTAQPAAPDAAHARTAEGTLTDAAASMVDEAAFERVETLEITFRYTAPKGE